MARAYYPSGDGSYKPWTADMVGAAAENHIHNNYLPTSGGTMSGAIRHNSKNNIFHSSGGSWITGKVPTNCSIVFDTPITVDGSRYDGYMWGQNVSGDVWNFGGGANNQIGFFGFNKDRTENSTDWTWGIDITSGRLTNPEVVVSSSQPTNSNAKIWVKI